jgi:hypothetical protein
MFWIINQIMDPNFGSNETPTKGSLDFKIFAWDFLGMFHCIWGINIFLVSKYGLLKGKEKWAWACIAISVIVWLLVDIFFTLTIGRNSFFAITIFLAVLFIVPLVMTKEVLRTRKSEG